MTQDPPPTGAAHDGNTMARRVDDPRTLEAGGPGFRRDPAPETAELVMGDRAYRLEGRGPWRVGRSKKSDITVPDSHVSRRHAKISRSEDGFVVEDLDSTNGTLLGGVPVERGRIESGDELTFGRVATARFVRRTDSVRPVPPTTGGARLPYLPGLDGLRALAVIAVLFYHAGLDWIPGGFLGVEIFFVLSGYLITSLLLAEWRVRGRVDLKNFWLRRARRLLPALYLLLLVTLAFAVAFLPGEVARLRDDALAAFGYVTNWYLVFNHQSYFETVGRPSLLQHLWSLAVEEQFYLLWPPLFLVGMTLLRRRLMPFAVLAGAVASSLLMAALYRPDVDPSRLYYGTDTRAAELLAGAVLAFAWGPGRFFTREAIRRDLLVERRRVGPLLDAVGLAALGGLVLFCLLLNEFQPFLYRGGFASVALVTVALIAVLVHPRARLGPLLGCRPLRWVGLRSYGIYLWHWPVFMVTRPGLDVPIAGPPLLALRLAATVALAALSYRLVEMPIRRGALGRAWGALREARGARRWRLGIRWATAIVAGVTFSAALGVAVVQAKPPAPPSYLRVKEIHTGSRDVAPADDRGGKGGKAPAEAKGAGDSATAQKTTETKEETAGAKEKTVSEKTAPAAAPADAPIGRVTAIGDSVMLGAAPQLEQDIGNLDVIDAVEGLQVQSAIGILQQRRAAGKIGDVVIVHLGDNGTFTAEQFDEIMGVLGSARRVVFVNDKVPRLWEQPNNEVIAEGVRRYSKKAVLVDWRAASAGHPGYFWGDGIHLRPEGARAYADLIASHLGG